MAVERDRPAGWAVPAILGKPRMARITRMNEGKGNASNRCHEEEGEPRNTRNMRKGAPDALLFAWFVCSRGSYSVTQGSWLVTRCGGTPRKRVSRRFQEGRTVSRRDAGTRRRRCIESVFSSDGQRKGRTDPESAALMASIAVRQSGGSLPRCEAERRLDELEQGQATEVSAEEAIRRARASIS